MAQKSGGLTENVRNNKAQTKNRIYKMINFILSLFLFTKSAYAGSICNDGTYSYSEGRGTCSHHGGVAVSGVYQNYSSTDKTLSQPRIQGRWLNDYGITTSGIPFHTALLIDGDNIFGYACFVSNNIGESISFAISQPNILNQPKDAVAPKEAIKVFAHTSSGYKVISGDWQWKSEDGTLTISKHNYVMESLAEPLNKNDMSNIILSDHFVVSVEDQEDVIIKTPGIARKVADTWNKCNASTNK